MSWRIFVDGASSGNPGDSGAGIVISDESGNEICRGSFYLGVMTNNMAEYEALLRGLQKIVEYGVREVTAHTDSLLVANQTKGIYKINNEVLRNYVMRVKEITRTLDHFTIEYIPREKNRIADKLAKEGTKKGADGWSQAKA